MIVASTTGQLIFSLSSTTLIPPRFTRMEHRKHSIRDRERNRNIMEDKTTRQLKFMNSIVQ